MTKMPFLSFAVFATLTAGCWSDRATKPGEARNSDPATVGTSGAAVVDRRVVAADPASQDARDFIHDVAVANMAEIDLAQLAAERGTADGVKQFARMMINDHSAAQDKMKSLAAELKIELPDQVDEKSRDQRDKLAKQSGPDFDREYATAMVDGHKDLIDRLEPRIDKKTLEQLKDSNGKTTAPAGAAPILPDKSDNSTLMRVNQFAAGMFPTVQTHLESARALVKSLDKREKTQ